MESSLCFRTFPVLVIPCECHESDFELFCSVEDVILIICVYDFTHDVLRMNDTISVGFSANDLPDDGPTSRVTSHIERMTPEDRAVCFHYKSLAQRTAIVTAGPAANFVLALALYVGLFIPDPIRPFRGINHKTPGVYESGRLTQTDLSLHYTPCPVGRPCNGHKEKHKWHFR